jgi:hypothetical protein
MLWAIGCFVIGAIVGAVVCYIGLVIAMAKAFRW